MSRLRTFRFALAAAAVAAGAGLAPPSSSAGTDRPRPAAAVGEEKVREVHRKAIVVDTHADTLWRVLDDGDDITIRSTKGHVDLPRMIDGGVDAQFFSVWPQPSYGPREWVERSLRLIDALHRTIDRSDGRMFLAVSADDIRRADREGKVAALLGIEGGHAIQDDLAILRTYYRLGVRYMTLTWSINTDWADSSGDDPSARGLTAFGRKVVQEMNRLGMLVDVSHVSDETFFDVLKATSAPVIASHSSCRALCDAPRNLTDEMLLALAKNGGVVMINYYPSFIDQRFRDARKAAAAAAKDRENAIASETMGDPAARERLGWALDAEIEAGIPAPPLDRLLDHIEHAAKVAGIDHVGLGSDFDGITSTPKGLEDVTKLPAITRGLLERGWSEEDVAKVLGGNLLRVFEQVERIAGNR